MYKIVYLPLARQDISDTALYIAGHLKAPQAALDLLNALDNGISRLKDFPYSCRVYHPAKPLKQEYRILLVKNYAVFYTVYEKDKTVEILRVIYAKRDFEKQL
ncbi:MAG: type II toxin-antitoxin system RelE/ParE family toxin [Clostridiales bacterium]|jgi:plasmid stabilization system protein ParE|nr:type II toxin-antitoxin system RelE/ParE family toxin [Clostridiales bacterium]